MMSAAPQFPARAAAASPNERPTSSWVVFCIPRNRKLTDMTLAEPVTDRMRSNSGDATTLVVDIEFGHNVLGSSYRHQKAEVARSASIAEELVTALTTCRR